jgi:hypothetical protein
LARGASLFLAWFLVLTWAPVAGAQAPADTQESDTHQEPSTVQQSGTVQESADLHEPATVAAPLDGAGQAWRAWPADVALEFAVRDACATGSAVGSSLGELPDWRLRAARVAVDWRAAWIGVEPEDRAAWRRAAVDPHPHVRRAAWRAFGHGSPTFEVGGALLEGLLADARDPWESLRVSAVAALGRARGVEPEGEQRVQAALAAALDDPSVDVVWQAALAWPERWAELDDARRASLPAHWLACFDALRDPDDRFSTLLLHGWRSGWPADFLEALWPASRAVGLEPERRALLAAAVLAAVERSPEELAADSWVPHTERAMELAPFAAPLFDGAFAARGEPWGRLALEVAGTAEGRGLSRWLGWAWLALGGRSWSAGVLAEERDPAWLEVALRVADEHPLFGEGHAARWRAAVEQADLWKPWLEVLTRAGQRGADWAAVELLEELTARSLERRLNVIRALGAIGVRALDPEREAEVRGALWSAWLELEDEVAFEALPDLAEREPPEAARDRLAALGRFHPERRPRLGAVLALRAGDEEVRLTLERWLAEDPFAYGRAEASERRAIARRLSGLLAQLHRGFPDASAETAAELLTFAVGRDAQLGRSAVRVLEAHPERRALLFGQLREGVELEIRAEAARAIAAAQPELARAEVESLAAWARRDAPRLSPHQAGDLLEALARLGGAPVRDLLIELLGGPDELPLFAADGLARLADPQSAAALARQVRSAAAFELRRSALIALGAQARSAEHGGAALVELERLLGELARLAADPDLETVRSLGFRDAEVPEVWGLLFASCRELQVRAGRWKSEWVTELWGSPLAQAADDLGERFAGVYLARADARWPLTWSFVDALARAGSLERATDCGLPWWRADARGLLDLGRRARELAPRAGEGPAAPGDGDELALLEAAVIGLLGEGPRARRDLRDALEELAVAWERRGAAARAQRIRARAELLAPGRPWPG